MSHRLNIRAKRTGRLGVERDVKRSPRYLQTHKTLIKSCGVIGQKHLKNYKVKNPLGNEMKMK